MAAFTVFVKLTARKADKITMHVKAVCVPTVLVCFNTYVFVKK